MRRGSVRTVKALLGCSGVNLNLGDREGGSLLSLIGEAGCEDVMRMLLGTAPVERKLIRIPWRGVGRYRFLGLL